MMNPQEIQESEYVFPYHYISQFRPGFNQSIVDTWGINYVSTIEFLLHKLESLPFSSIVDIGCGDGRFSRDISLRFPGINVTGIDYSDRAINLARAINHGAVSVQFSTCDITSQQVMKQHDAAILMEVIEHIPPELEQAFLDGVHRLLKKNGRLLVTVPHINQKLDAKHFRHFTVDSIAKLLNKRFEILEVVPFERIAMLRNIISLLLANELFILNNKRLLSWIYKIYKDRLFACRNEHECRRLFVLAVAK